MHPYTDLAPFGSQTNISYPSAKSSSHCRGVWRSALGGGGRQSLASPPLRHWYENALQRLLSTPANPYIRHSREGGNPRTNIPRKNANRDTTTYVHTATPLRLSRKSMRRTPIRGRNPGGGEAAQMPLERTHQPAPRFSYLGVPAAAGMSDWYENSTGTVSPGPQPLPNRSTGIS